KPGSVENFLAKLIPFDKDIGFQLFSEPTKQKAWLDGQLLQHETPMTVTRIATGTHKVEIKATGCYGLWSHDVMVESGKPKPVLHATLKPTVVNVNIQSEPPHAKTYLIEGGIRTVIGETPLQGVKLDASKSYSFTLARPGYKETTQEIHFDGTCEQTA